MLVKVKDNAHLARDMASGAIINTNTVEYQNYLKKVNSQNALKDQVQENTETIEQIKTDISEIKNLLISLINKES
jgi:hypothetical protein